MNSRILVPVVALLCGAALGYALAPAGDVSVAPTRAPRVSASKSDDAELESLRARNDRLRRELGELKRRVQSGVETVVTNVVPSVERDRHDSPWKMMERLKKEDPARYARMTNNFATFQRRQREASRSRKEFFASLETSGFSPEELETHMRLQALAAEREELEKKIFSKDATREERHEMHRRMGELMEALNAANMAEREMLVRSVAGKLGLSDDDAEVFASTMQEIFDNTSLGFGPDPGRGPRSAPRGNDQPPPVE